MHLPGAPAERVDHGIGDAVEERLEELASRDAQAKKENCARAQDHVRTIESGQRLSRTDSKGERQYLDDSQVAQELAKARQAAQEWCK